MRPIGTGILGCLAITNMSRRYILANQPNIPVPMGRVTYGSAKQPNIPVPMGSFWGKLYACAIIAQSHRMKGKPVATISTADFRNGMCIVNNGKMCTIVEFQHVKPGKGGAFVRTKLKDIKTGRVVDYTFNSGTKFESQASRAIRLPAPRNRQRLRPASRFRFPPSSRSVMCFRWILATDVSSSECNIFRKPRTAFGMNRRCGSP